MHDVRMQLLDVFRWLCPVVGVQRSGFLTCSAPYSQDWRFPVADGCAGLQLSSFLSGWSPYAWLLPLLPASPPCTAWSKHVLRWRSLHRVSSMLLCVHLSCSPVFFLFIQCRHSRIQCMIPDTWLLSSSTLVGGLLPRRLHFLSILSLTPLTYDKRRNLGVVACSCSSVRVEEWGACGKFWGYGSPSVLGTHLLGRLASGGSVLQSVWWHGKTFLALVPMHLMMLDLILAWWWES